MLTTAQAAEKLGIVARTVRLICFKNNIGTEITPRMRLLEESDLEMIQAARNPVGRPPAVKPEAANKPVKAKKRRKLV